VPVQLPAGLLPATRPDVVVLSVSGHDGALNAALCVSDTNRAYLGDPGEAVGAVAQTFADLGLTVAVVDLSDRLSGPDADRDGLSDRPDQMGFIELLLLMERIYQDWMVGQAVPTRLVIVAHSHGGVWAHIATSVMSHVPVSYLVTLDGICLLWECEHEDAVRDWVRRDSPGFAWDISVPCAAWSVPGFPGLLDTKDVVFDNVDINLEVQSTDLFVSDDQDNTRLDGSQAGIATYVAPEGHNGVRDETSDAVAWVTAMIAAAEQAP